MSLLFAVASTGAVVVWVVARRGRAAAAVVSYSLPWLMKVSGAAVEFDLVEFFATGLALAAVFAFFGGMLAVQCANVRCCGMREQGWLSRGRNEFTLMSRRVGGKLELQAPRLNVGWQGRSDRRSIARDNPRRDEQIGRPGSLHFTSPLS